MIREQIRFFGEVQGVGFRWRARHAAQMYDCTGWCRNEWDGSVTMEIQGRREAIDLVLQSVAAGRYIEIQSMDRIEIPVQENERGFETR